MPVVDIPKKVVCKALGRDFSTYMTHESV